MDLKAARDGADDEQRDKIDAMIRTIQAARADPEGLEGVLDSVKRDARDGVEFRHWHRGKMQRAPWMRPESAQKVVAAAKKPSAVKYSSDVPVRVLVIGGYKGKATQAGVVAVHGAVASVSARQSAEFWSTIAARVSEAYAPLVLEPLEAVFVTDELVDAGASLACALVGTKGLTVVAYAAHCRATPPDAQFRYIGSFVAGDRVFVVSAKKTEKERRIRRLLATRIDRSGDNGDFLRHVRSKAEYMWASHIDEVIDAVANPKAQVVLAA
jgi:hypothetical protein